MKINTNDPADLSAQIAKAIRDAIIAGQLIIDERLPSEQELAEQFQVSRPTVREALETTGCAITDPNPAWRLWRGIREPHPIPRRL
jgi:DNA-binding GntR family transcriptional regulator